MFDLSQQAATRPADLQNEHKANPQWFLLTAVYLMAKPHFKET